MALLKLIYIKKYIMRKSLLHSFIFLFIFLYNSILAQTSKADNIEFENAQSANYMNVEEGEGGIVKLFGRIKIKFKSGGYILANKVVIDTSSQEFYAEGDLRYLTNNNSEIKAERLIYSRRLGQGVLYNARGFNNPIYFIGKNIRILGNNRLLINHVRFTTSLLKNPHYHFTAKLVGFYEDGTFFATGVLYYVGGVPLIAFPFLYSSPFGTGIKSQLGRGDTQGNFIQNTYSFGVPSVDKFKGILPNYYSFTFDTYQVTGSAIGITAERKASNLDYSINLGYAKFQRYDLVNGSITNQVQKCTGADTSTDKRICTTGTETYDWKKINIILNSKLNEIDKNHIRNIIFYFKNYGNYVYDYEFGKRFNPTATFPALYSTLRLDGSRLQPLQGWYISYEEVWDTLSLKVKAKRDEVWTTRQNFQDSSYDPAQDILPNIALSKRFTLGKIPYFNTNVNWFHEINYLVTKNFQNGNEFINSSLIEYKSKLNLSLPFTNWFYWDPLIGYGARKNTTTIVSDDAVLKASVLYEGQRQSYQYLYSENKFGFGDFKTQLEITQRNKVSFKEERADIPEISRNGLNNNQTLNETEFNFNWIALAYLNFNINTIYDGRPYPSNVTNNLRWYYPIFRTDFLIDWFNLFEYNRENLLSRNKVAFIQNHITNDFIYDPTFNRSHSNILGLNLELGGFDTKGFKRLRYLEIGLLWYHVYFDPNLDHLRYVFKSDWQISDNIYWEFALESRASDPNRYNSNSIDRNNNKNSVNFINDIGNSFGLGTGNNARKTVFNIYALSTGLILDLKDWEFRLDYEIQQSYIPQLSNNILGTVYYDRRLSFGLNLIRVSLGKVSRPSRFLIDQQRPTF